MKKRFGIDIDGTITRPDTLIPYINKSFALNLTLNDITQYELTPFVNVSEDEFRSWFEENEPLIYKESPISEGAKETINTWMDIADLYFISARRKNLTQLTKEWFHANELKYHHIELIGSHDKVATAKKYQIDLFFEDKHDNAVAISEECNIPVILFNTPYNQEPVPSRVIRVNTWEEAKKWVDHWLKSQ
jgi:uncharacterized HAD superfamily protein